MTDIYKKLVEDIRENAKKSTIQVEINNAWDYISVCRGVNDEYFFQGDDIRYLEEDFKNSGVCNDVTMEEYLKYVAPNW